MNSAHMKLPTYMITLAFVIFLKTISVYFWHEADVQTFFNEYDIGRFHCI